ncbi:MAG: hypothetical protein FJ221_06320 [Lentisphaerae bacterium]|nr:hypothetical protein [Lentisphaerota bacterium]
MNGTGDARDFPMPPGAAALNLLGVDYAHVKTGDGGDLYLTRFGAPFAEHLKPESWFEPGWFERNREKLEGTSTVYRVRTRPLGGRSKDIVVKWCRVGTEIPVDTFTLTKFVEAEFNSPYEEFSLVMEMRADRSTPRVRTHKPLAIYVPAKKFKPWQIRRVESKMERMKAKFRDVELDIFRQYILIYEWVKGVSLPEAFLAMPGSIDERRAQIRRLAGEGVGDLAEKGFRVLDIKPEHMIVRPRPPADFLRRRDGRIAYALVDFELLQRTPEHESAVASARRAAYLRHQKDRFAAPSSVPLPPHLRAASVFGIDYICGHTESTGGELWVVGRDPELFDYFLPERWRRTPRERLSDAREVWKTRTKDQVNLVWKVSRVGEVPEPDPAGPRAARIREHGFNSPFEEFEIALRLARDGVPVVYPRAIYMTGQEAAGAAAYAADTRRYDRDAAIPGPDGRPALRRDHNYITVWGYWNGADETLATRDVAVCSPLSLARALAGGRVTAAEHDALLAGAAEALARAGYEDLNLGGGHLLLSVPPQGGFLLGDDGRPVVRWCNFSLMRARATASTPAA